MSEADSHYRLDDQVGFILRRASQRHLSIYARTIPDLPPMQFAAMAKLKEAGALSQNALGRLTAMDAATIKGVVDRLGKRQMVTTRRDTKDKRRTIVSLTNAGEAAIKELQQRAENVSLETLTPLSSSEQAIFLHLLRKIT